VLYLKQQLIPTTDSLLEFLLTSIIEIETGSTTALETEIDALIECLLEAEAIVEETP
jgi:hypothetical protein